MRTDDLFQKKRSSLTNRKKSCGRSETDGHMGCVIALKACGSAARWTQASSPRKRGALKKRGFNVMGSSDKVHVVDALAITGEEGRASLRKAWGSWQRSFDPAMSEWGNPALHRTLSAQSAKSPLMAKNKRGIERALCEGSSRPESIGTWKRTRRTETSQ